MGELLPDCLPKFLRPNYGLNNGLLFNEIFIPEEVLLHIISFITPQDLLKCSFVCHKWNQLIKSHALWAVIYKRRYNRRARKLPWYFYYSLLSENYFDTNLLKNGSGEEAFNYWTISSYGDGFTVEHLPLNAEPLPANVPELKDHSTCFVSAGGTCSKSQTIKLGRSKLFQYILHNYKPHIYVSDLMASGFNCDCVYILECTFLNKSGVEIAQSTTRHNVFQGDGSGWKKVKFANRFVTCV